MSDKKVSIGVVCIVLNNNNEILLGKRIGKRGNGMWQFPGGHHEFGETMKETAIRETKEETNLHVLYPSFITYSEEIKNKNQYLTMYFISTCIGDLINKEPHKCSGWKWFSFKDIPENIYEVDNKLKLELNQAIDDFIVFRMF